MQCCLNPTILSCCRREEAQDRDRLLSPTGTLLAAVARRLNSPPQNAASEAETLSGEQRAEQAAAPEAASATNRHSTGHDAGQDSFLARIVAVAGAAIGRSGAAAAGPAAVSAAERPPSPDSVLDCGGGALPPSPEPLRRNAPGGFSFLPAAAGGSAGSGASTPEVASAPRCEPNNRRLFTHRRAVSMPPTSANSLAVPPNTPGNSGVGDPSSAVRYELPPVPPNAAGSFAVTAANIANAAAAAGSNAVFHRWTSSVGGSIASVATAQLLSSDDDDYSSNDEPPPPLSTFRGSPQHGAVRVPLLYQPAAKQKVNSAARRHSGLPAASGGGSCLRQGRAGSQYSSPKAAAVAAAAARLGRQASAETSRRLQLKHIKGDSSKSQQNVSAKMPAAELKGMKADAASNGHSSHSSSPNPSGPAADSALLPLHAGGLIVEPSAAAVAAVAAWTRPLPRSPLLRRLSGHGGNGSSGKKCRLVVLPGGSTVYLDENSDSNSR